MLLPLVLSPGGTFEPPGELLEDTGYLLSWLGVSPGFDIEKEPSGADESLTERTDLKYL